MKIKILLILSITILLSCNKNNKKSLYIFVDNKNVTNNYIDYNNLGENEIKTITITSKYGTNKIEISKHSAKCIYSDCKTQYCVKSNTISDNYDNEMIICLPHKLAIYFH